MVRRQAPLTLPAKAGSFCGSRIVASGGQDHWFPRMDNPGDVRSRAGGKGTAARGSRGHCFVLPVLSLVAAFVAVSLLQPSSLIAEAQVNFSTGWYNGKRSLPSPASTFSAPSQSSSLQQQRQPQEQVVLINSDSGSGVEPKHTVGDTRNIMGASRLMMPAGIIGSIPPGGPPLASPQQAQMTENDEAMGTPRRAAFNNAEDGSRTDGRRHVSQAGVLKKARAATGGDFIAIGSPSMAADGYPENGNDFYGYGGLNSPKGGRGDVFMTKRIPIGPDELIERLEASVAGASGPMKPDCRIVSPMALNNIYRLLFREAERMLQCGRIRK